MQHGSLFRFWTILLLAAAFGSLASCGGGSESGGSGGGGGGGANDPIVGIRLTPTSATIAPGANQSFKAEALNAAGAVVTASGFSFAIQDERVARLQTQQAGDAVVTGLAAGSTTLTAGLGNFSTTATITVPGATTRQITGIVVDAVTGARLANASVQRNGESAAQTTDADGSYLLTLPVQPGAQTQSTIAVSRDGYIGTTVILNDNIGPAANSQVTTAEPILLLPAGSPPGSITGIVRNARDNVPLSGVTVNLYSGQGDAAAQQASLASTTTDGLGGFNFPSLAAGVYTVSTLPSGFSSCTRTSITVGAGSSLAQDLACSPADSQQIRIVLTWGSTPEDLDAHLTGPDATGPGRFHVYFPDSGVGDANAAPFAVLDVDDISSYGPETMTLTQLNAGGFYRYSVHDFTNLESSTSTAMAGSGAKVELYLPGVATPQVFFVPNQPGTLWTVFELSGPIGNPTVTPRNQMGFAADPSTIP